MPSNFITLGVALDALGESIECLSLAIEHLVVEGEAVGDLEDCRKRLEKRSERLKKTVKCLVEG